MNFLANPHLAGVVGHLEQSTFVVLVAWMVTLVLRQNRPGARFWIWFLASIKFLLPFAILVDAGEWLGSVVGGPIREPVVVDVIRRIPLPFTIAPPVASPGFSTNAHASDPVFVMIALVWGSGSLILMIRWWFKWRRIRGIVRHAVPSGLLADVPVLFTSGLPELGVCGVVSPVLLLPSSIRNHLSQDQLNAIISHEMSHVRRRDNLLFAIHMTVETLFWFHPLVWWIGSHLIEERERACDEAALLAGNDASAYAQSIINVCKCRLDSAPLWVSGITGANLQNRINRIVEGHSGKRLGANKFAFLAAVGLSLSLYRPVWD